MELKNNIYLKLSKLKRNELINLANKHDIVIDTNSKKEDLVNILFYYANNKKKTNSYKTPSINNYKQPMKGGQVYAVIGQRPTMEDTHLISKLDDVYLYAVFDGHGGNETSDILPKLINTYLLEPLKDVNLRYNEKKLCNHIKYSFITIDNIIQKTIKDDSGSTATIVMNINPFIYSINLGDSRSVIYKINKDKGQLVFGSKDHKPDEPEETKRIYQSGGFVETEQGDDARLDGYLAISRSFGDFELKYNNNDIFKGPLSIEPDIKVIKKNEKFKYFSIVACDGLWDVMDNQTAINYITEYGLENGAENLVKIALHKNSTDNVSAIVTVI